MSLSGFKRPTLEALKQRMVAGVNAALPEIDANLRYSVVGVLTDVLAGAVHSLYGYLDWISDQTNLLYCSDDNLDAFGLIWGIDRKEATRAVGTVTMTGKNGSVIPIGTTLQTRNGKQYSVIAEATIASQTATVSVEAAEFGVDWNQAEDVVVTLLNPVSGVDSTGAVISIAGGADLESDAAYRARILARIANPPQGGSKADYIAWALAVPGVTRAWCNALENGPGTVVVRFMMDDAYTDGVPQSGDITIVAAAIEALRPVTAQVSVVAPATSALAVTVLDLTPDNATTRAAIRAEIADMIARRAEPGGTIYLSDIWESVAQASGVEHFTISVPTADVDYAVGTLPIPGTVTFAVTP